MPLSVHVSGWKTCGFYRRARSIVEGLSLLYPTKLSGVIKEFETRDEYKSWLAENSSLIKSGTQTSSPYCWYGDTPETFTRIGGHDDTVAWCRQLVNAGGGGAVGATEDVVYTNDTFGDHEFDYDCVVIGGGSGGLACSKEIALLGKKVACLDFVKPSPQGSTWGLGGTCVNVGCIPKKLMHTAALMGEHAVHAKAYGWTSSSENTHDWATMRQNVQDHIKGLNFGYRVQLREKGVQYLNKLGKFKDSNTLVVVDKKGRESTITARRFVVAVGGRPSKLSCPGAEHAISSDDIFSLEAAPGKTCVIGAGYVALECAGFLSGLKQGDVTVAVRSVPLRGFDQDVVKHVVHSLEHVGTKFRMGVTPSSIEKSSDGLVVTFSDGTSEQFDTVLAATGRYADTEALGLSGIVDVNPKNGKIICKNEQTSQPNIYAIGDVVDGCPELTPVAIQAGKLLAHRLFGDAQKTMDYKAIATTVFTPLEFGTIGYTEDEAKEKMGADNVDAYLSLFTPLEWTVVQEVSELTCYAKIVVDKSTTEVLGMHIAAPNAGEIIQGFGVAFRKGMKYEDLTDTVGIHPTTAEELVGMTITRSSGEKVEKSSC